MRVGVVLSTYNQPELLEKALWGYAAQSHTDFEVVVADDGSGAETGALLRRMCRLCGLRIRHVWHADRGFRKCEILNRALVSTPCEYLIFSDGDCVPRRDFVAAHVRNAAPGRFLSGGYLKLPPQVSDRVTPAAIASGAAFRVGWLRAQGWRPGRRVLRLSSGPSAVVLDALTPTQPTWNGHNASTWRDDLFRVNGYDMEMGYGGEDRALGERLHNLGLRGVRIRYQAPCLHLHHERPYVDPETMRWNRRFRESIRREKRIKAKQGIAELNWDPRDRDSCGAGRITT